MSTAKLALLVTFLFAAGSCSRPAANEPPDQDAKLPDQVNAAPLYFQDEAAASGLTFEHLSGETLGDPPRLFPHIMGGGVAVLDIDQDGWLDVYFVQSGRLTGDRTDQPANELFRNNGDGTFSDISGTSGAAADRGYGMGVATGDYDDDGDPDLYVTNVGPNTLLRNDGGGRFTNVTAEAGVGDDRWGTSAAFVDIDHDGDLDLFACNYVGWAAERDRECYASSGQPDYCSPNSYAAPLTDVLYRNNGDGTFTDVSASAGLNTAFGNGLGVVCGDFDADGRIDIFVANDQMANQLWQNQTEPDGKITLRDVAPIVGCAVDEHGEPKAGMGTDAADIDDDGDLDLIVVNLRAQSDSLFRNQGGYFLDDTGRSGLGSASRPFTRFGMAWVDLDNDGVLDLFEVNGRVAIGPVEPWATDDVYAEPNVLMLGRPGGLFESYPQADGLVHTSRGAAFGDLDNDGDIDVVVVNRDAPAYLLRNTGLGDHQWALLDVRDESGRTAIGASLQITIDAAADQSPVLRRDVRTAYSYCAANDPRVHVGLGRADDIDRILVTWTDGSHEVFGPIPANTITRIEQGSGQRQQINP